MKRALIAGLIAGVIAGAVAFTLCYVGIKMEVPILSYRYALHRISPLTFGLRDIALGIIWGVIFSTIYSYFYDYIPGTGVRKGFIFSLILWAAGSVRPAALSGAHAWTYAVWLWAAALTFVGFLSTCTAYGLVLGALYKKPSD